MMTMSHLNRRDFHKLSAAAFGGLLAGTAVGCGRNEEPETDPAAPSPDGSDTRDPSGQSAGTETQQIMLEEPHVCRGLNACEGMGAQKENACAGQGTCATAAAHDCHEMNECKGQGGCGDTAGRNACKGQGECAVPLKEETWVKARQAYEQAMQAAGKAFGNAPPKS